MTDTEILDWINAHASQLGMRPDWTGTDPETGKLMFELTDIRKKVRELAASSPNAGSQPCRKPSTK